MQHAQNNIEDSYFRKYRSAIIAAQASTARDERLLIERTGNLSIYYAPFEHVNHAAKIVLVGITPGPTQMVNANAEMARCLKSGMSAEDALIQAKRHASFSGEPMRSNLALQLNHWGVNEWLGVADCDDLFAERSDLVQNTSLLRYPVFVGSEGYRGAPNMMKNPMLRRHLFKHFVPELDALPDALLLPLGPAVAQVLSSLCDEGFVARDRCLIGLLHPSGNNTYRIRYLTGDQEAAPPHATKPTPYNEGRLAFRSMWS